MKMRLSDLKEAPYNPRTISQSEFNGLKNSLSLFGDLSGITFNKTTGNLVSGHQRAKVLQDKYGDLEIVMVSDEEGYFSTPEGNFKVRFVEWDLLKEKAGNIAANSQEISGKNTAGLIPLVEELSLEAPDLVSNLRIDAINLQPLSTDGLLNDLQENEFVSLVSDKSDCFAMTFVFPKTKKDVLTQYVIGNGKEEITKAILHLVEG